MTDNRKLLLTLAFLNVLWSPVNVLVGIARENGLSGVALGQIRWTSIAILLGLCLLHPGFRKVTRAVWPTPLQACLAALCGFCFFGPAHILYYTSLGHTSSVEGTVLLTTAPLWTAAMSFLILREKLTYRRMGALGLAIFGAYVVSFGFRAATLGGNFMGNFGFLSAVILESLGGVLVTVLVRKASGITILWFQFLGAVPVFWIAPLLLPNQLTVTMHPGLPALLAVGYLIVICGVFTFSMWYMLAEKAPLTLMVLTLPIQPPLAALLAWLNHEPLTLNMLWGTLIILVALFIGFGERSKKEITPLEAPTL